MHLRSITLKGFKSFPDRTRLEFSPGVSVIVGPNGSGKSNVTDAVLWALGEQSPLAVRGQSMQDVIFAGAHGVQARSEAEVEVVLDNGDGAVDLPLSEISIVRRLSRAGEGEYRVNGARCRLGDVLELLSDTGLGKEMHSVVSQGRVEAIVTSKPRDRRLLIEEAAGLGKHRKRRRRAQLKLDRTQDNLDRALDVEREARTRLKPLKRQAEAAELHERLARQSDEAHWSLARDDARAAAAALARAEEEAARARAAAAAAEAELAEVAARRERAEGALAARGDERDRLAGRFHAARSAAERIAIRLEAARAASTGLAARAAARERAVAALEAEAAADAGDADAPARVAALEAELARLAEDRAVRLERELAELEAGRLAAAAEAARLSGEAEGALAARRAAEAVAEAARRELRARETAADAARRAAARAGSELAGINQFLRAHAGAPGGAPALADALAAAPGYELALAAALGPRSRAAVAEDRGEAARLVERAGRDGGAALVAPAAGAPPVAVDRRGPGPGAVRLLDHVRAPGGGAAARLADALLADVWVVEDASAVASGFAGVAVTRDGRVWTPAARELRQVPHGGEDRVLAERNRRDAQVAEVERAARAEQAAQAEVERAAEAVRAAEAGRDDAEQAARAAARARDAAAEAERHARSPAGAAAHGARRGPGGRPARAPARRARHGAAAGRAGGAREARARAADGGGARPRRARDGSPPRRRAARARRSAPRWRPSAGGSPCSTPSWPPTGTPASGWRPSCARAPRGSTRCRAA